MTARSWILVAVVAAAVAAHVVAFHVGLRTSSLVALAVVVGVVLVGHRPLIDAVLRRVRGRPRG